MTWVLVFGGGVLVGLAIGIIGTLFAFNPWKHF